LEECVRVVILVPRREDHGRRDELWHFTKTWLAKHHPEFKIFEGGAPEGPFNRGAALNAAAKAAGDWDVAIVHDGDNIVSPAKLIEAVDRAVSTQLTHIAHDTYMYLDRESSDSLLASPDGPWWPRPQIDDLNRGYAPYLIHKHVSGVVVVPRSVWDATDGFVELTGWGSEDSLHIVLCNAFGGGVRWLSGTALHLWHEHAAADISRVLRHRNRSFMLTAKSFETRKDLAGLRRHLATVGHAIP
jgi:hypothetical protein